MTLAPVIQWIAFSLFTFIAVAGALGMTTTMGMFRSGIFLMASFIGVAGLFILLLADLLSLLQVMMYIAGMLVMILFMVLFTSDPGGAMMTSMMELKGLEKLFSRGLAHGAERHQGMQPGGGGMSMFTPAKRAAMLLAPVVGVLLCVLLIFRRPWRVVSDLPDQDSARRVGELLMTRYMIAFEGAGLLILLGIFGAVMVSRPGAHPDSTARDELAAAVPEPPAPIAAEPVEPLAVDPAAVEEAGS